MTMPNRKDPLLRGTRLMIALTSWVAGLAAAAVATGIPLIWIFGGHLKIQIGGDGAVLTGAGQLLGLTALLAVIGVFAALAFLFLRKLIAIIDSVHQGSPFIPENARRLRLMGWFVLAANVIAMFDDPLQLWLTRNVPDADIELSFSFGWLITALLLFILARVFEQGTRLAEDAEGLV